MVRLGMVAACAALVFSVTCTGADVVVKDGEKSAKAKVGDVVEIQISNPALAKMKENFKAEASGKVLAKAVITDEVHKSPDGKPMAGGGYKSVKLKAESKGKAKVTVTWEQDGKKGTAEVDVTVE